LLDSTEFQTWINNDSQTLFCPGIPGVGKTILTSVVVNELTTRFSSDPTVGLAFIYFNFRRQDEQKINDLLASLLKQLAESQPSLPVIVKDLYNRHKTKRTKPSFDEILKVLQTVAMAYSRVFIIIDALDEYQASDNYRSRLLAEIFSLQAKSSVNFFATSRPNYYIKREFKGCISFEICARDEDVYRYLEGYMFKLPGFVVRRLDLQEEIKAEITKAVDGMYVLYRVLKQRSLD
jgi:Cdc6-like AAA superfamily ATPase